MRSRKTKWKEMTILKKIAIVLICVGVILFFGGITLQFLSMTQPVGRDGFESHDYRLRNLIL